MTIFNEISDEDIIISLQRGDDSKLELLIERYQKKLFFTAFHFVKSYHIASEIVQEVFIKVYKKINSFKFNSSFYTWAYRITVNTSINWLKKKENRRNVSMDEHQFLEKYTAVDSRMEEKVLLDEEKEQIMEAIDKLPEKHKEVIILYYMEELKYHEIASILDVQIGTIMSRLFNAKNKLHDLLKRDYNEKL